MEELAEGCAKFFLCFAVRETVRWLANSETGKCVREGCRSGSSDAAHSLDCSEAAVGRGRNVSFATFRTLPTGAEQICIVNCSPPRGSSANADKASGRRSAGRLGRDAKWSALARRHRLRGRVRAQN